MAYVIVAVLFAAAGAVASYFYHSAEVAKVAAVRAEIAQLESEAVAVESHAIARIKALPQNYDQQLLVGILSLTKHAKTLAGFCEFTAVQMTFSAPNPSRRSRIEETIMPLESAAARNS